MIRIAAAGDVHFDRNSAGRLRKYLKLLEGRADVLLLAGDLTQTGHSAEGEVLASDLYDCPIPVVAVLGNHDYHLDHESYICESLKNAGVHVLEKENLQLSLQGCTVGIVGLKGFGGGFVGASGSDFGEPEMKAFIRHTKGHAKVLREHLEALNTDYKIVLMHYSPIEDTLHGEKREIYPFLGSYLLGEAIDAVGADIVFHGHAHRGVERGETPGGVPVRNVAQHVIRHVFNIYTLNKEGIVTHSSLAPHGTSA
ncbi:MAG: metallophosphoesterase [Bdellovibrionota bacterium]